MFFPKLIVTDLDGTALKNDKTISDRTIQAFSGRHGQECGKLHPTNASDRLLFCLRHYYIENDSQACV